MKKFAIKILLALTFTIVFICYMLTLGVNHNLHLPINTLNSFIIGEPYDENLAMSYKWEKDISKYELVAIGSSRVLQFKSEFFREPFFNLGYLVGTPKQTLELIRLKNIKNKKLIISLDQWAFNSQWIGESNSNFTAPKRKNFIRMCFSKNRIFDAIKLKNVPKLRVGNSRIKKIGASAKLAFNGILPDGSYYYGKQYSGLLNNKIELINDFNFSDTKDRIVKGNRRFEYGNVCNSSSIYELKELMEFNKMQGNTAYYFFPPFAPSVQEKLKGINYLYIKDASLKVTDLAKNLKVPFFDFTFFESEDSMYIDGFHGGALVYYKLTNFMGLTTKQTTFINQFELMSDSSYISERNELFRVSQKNNFSND